MTDSVSTAITVRTSGNLEQTRELVQILAGAKEAPVEIAVDPEQAQHEMILRILSAGSEAELERSKAFGLSTRLGVAYRLLSYRWLPTQFRDKKTNKPIGLPVFIVIQAVNIEGGQYTDVETGEVTTVEPGETETLTTSSAQIVATVAKLDEFGRIPGAIRCAVRATEKTKQGFYPMWLETPPQFAEEDRRARAVESAAA